MCRIPPETTQYHKYTIHVRARNFFLYLDANRRYLDIHIPLSEAETFDSQRRGGVGSLM